MSLCHGSAKLEAEAGALRDMLAALVANEDALRQALHTSEETELVQKEIERILQSVGGIDVASNLAAGAAQATRMADELGRALSNAISLSSQGVGGLERSRSITFSTVLSAPAGTLVWASNCARARAAVRPMASSRNS